MNNKPHQIKPKKILKKPQIFAHAVNDINIQNGIWHKYVSKFQSEPDSPADLHAFAKYKFNTKFNDLSYRQCKTIYDKLSSKPQNEYVAHTNTPGTSSSNDQQTDFPKITVSYVPFTKPQTSKYAKYSQSRTNSRPRAHTVHNGKQAPFSGCRRSIITRNHSKSVTTEKPEKSFKTNSKASKKPPLSSYINKIGTSQKKHEKSFNKLSLNHLNAYNYKIAKKIPNHKKKDSILSIVSDLSVVNNSRYNRKNSILSNIDGPFSILPQIICEEKQTFAFEELIIDETKQNVDINIDEKKQNEHDLNITIEVPINPATEIFGNFLGALCGLCVPVMDVISSLQSAEEYELLSQYAENIDESGNAQTLLLYEQLDGVSLFDLKQQLQVAEISLSYSSNINNNSSITTQERIQRYFVNVVRKTFGLQLPNHFSHDGKEMVRDAGFLFAIDMLLFNINRFPVLLPFEGKSNANNLFISTDQDGDSVLYGLRNRFMGGHNIIDMPRYLVNAYGSDILTKQRKQTNEYIETVEIFLVVLADYYQRIILPKIQNMNELKLNKLLHGLPSNNPINIKQELETKISHGDCIELCLRPIANFLYIHCGFELIIIDEYNTKRSPIDNDNDNDEIILKALELYRNKLIDNMITLLCEGILIGIQEISEQVKINDIDTIIKDIKDLDENMVGIKLISSQFLKEILKLFHSTSNLYQLYIEDDYDNDD